jgi:LysM repeat protein
VDGQDNETHVSMSVPPPPPYRIESSVPPLDSRTRVHALETESQEESPPSSHIKSDPGGNTTDDSRNSSSQAGDSQKMRTAPYKYHVNRNDTLQGIALRFGLDVSCRPF